jgi:hypothetical protein
MTFKERIEKARQHNEAFDKIDRQHGNATPAEAGSSALFATGMEAIKAGLHREDFDMVAQGYLMLRQFRDRFDVVRVQISPKSGMKTN